jgi:hypothetical protein
MPVPIHEIRDVQGTQTDIQRSLKNYITRIGCAALNNNKIKHISEMKADIKLCASSFSVVTLRVFFNAWSGSSSRRMHMALSCWVTSCLASIEEIFSVMQKTDRVLRLAELKSYTSRVRRKFNQVYHIYKSDAQRQAPCHTHLFILFCTKD